MKLPSPRRSQKSFRHIPEPDHPFLSLWPHRFDYLFAPHPSPSESPSWQTESRHSLSDRLIIQGAFLYGVRHGPKTSYALLDIDSGSPYHPKRDPIAFYRLRTTLESLGLVADLVLTSSDSGGLQVYLPIDGEVVSWKLGTAITTVLENAGFKVFPGWLEVFPNRKPYAADGSKTSFNGHRLPLQHGSYLLNDNLEPTHSSHEAFCRQWDFAAKRNTLSTKVMNRIIKQAKRKNYRVTGKAQKFLNDLNAEIELGWTGQGQTNRLLGRIAMRSFIFGHILYADRPLEGQELVKDIARVAKSLPGFKDFCRHRHELMKKAKEWVRAIAKSHYFHYSSSKSLKVKDRDSNEEAVDSSGIEKPTWNEKQAVAARQRVQEGVLDLCRQEAMPELATHRYNLLCGYGVSARTLYKNSDLWHPNRIEAAQLKLMQTVAVSLSSEEEESLCAVGAAASSKGTSLLVAVGGNIPSDKGSRLRLELKNGDSGAVGGNVPSIGGSSRIEVDSHVRAQVVPSPPPKQLVLEIQQSLAEQQAQRLATTEQQQAEYRLQRQQQAQAEHVERLREWMSSGDSILVAEAKAQLERLEMVVHSR